MATRASPPARKRAGGSEAGDVDPALPQKKRARHRLIGAIALCLLAAIVVPLLLDAEPTRPTSDVAIVIPSRDTPLPPRATAAGVVRGAPEGTEPSARDGAARAADVKPVDTKGSDTKGADAKGADAKGADPKPADSKPADAKPAKSEPRKDGRDEIAQLADAAQARTRGEGRYLLQVGAYANESGAATAVERVQSTGLRAFTEKIKTDRGNRVRVRVGPFTSRDAAEQARTQLQAAGVQAAMIAP
jgi:DedD protein